MVGRERAKERNRSRSLKVESRCGSNMGGGDFLSQFGGSQTDRIQVSSARFSKVRVTKVEAVRVSGRVPSHIFSFPFFRFDSQDSP